MIGGVQQPASTCLSFSREWQVGIEYDVSEVARIARARRTLLPFCARRTRAESARNTPGPVLLPRRHTSRICYARRIIGARERSQFPPATAIHSSPYYRTVTTVGTKKTMHVTLLKRSLEQPKYESKRKPKRTCGFSSEPNLRFRPPSFLSRSMNSDLHRLCR